MGRWLGIALALMLLGIAVGDVDAASAHAHGALLAHHHRSPHRDAKRLVAGERQRHPRARRRLTPADPAPEPSVPRSSWRTPHTIGHASMARTLVNNMGARGPPVSNIGQLTFAGICTIIVYRQSLLPAKGRTQMDPLAKYRKPRGRPRSTCHACGASSTGARIVVTLQERQANDHGGHNYPAISSKSAAFCAPCAAELYGEMIKGVEH